MYYNNPNYKYGNERTYTEELEDRWVTLKGSSCKFRTLSSVSMYTDITYLLKCGKITGQVQEYVPMLHLYMYSSNGAPMNVYLNTSNASFFACALNILVEPGSINRYFNKSITDGWCVRSEYLNQIVYTISLSSSVSIQLEPVTDERKLPAYKFVFYKKAERVGHINMTKGEMDVLRERCYGFVNSAPIYTALFESEQLRENVQRDMSQMNTLTVLLTNLANTVNTLKQDVELIDVKIDDKLSTAVASIITTLHSMYPNLISALINSKDNIDVDDTLNRPDRELIKQNPIVETIYKTSNEDACVLTNENEADSETASIDGVEGEVADVIVPPVDSQATKLASVVSSLTDIVNDDDDEKHKKQFDEKYSGFLEDSYVCEHTESEKDQSVDLVTPNEISDMLKEEEEQKESTLNLPESEPLTSDERSKLNVSDANPVNDFELKDSYAVSTDRRADTYQTLSESHDIGGETVKNVFNIDTPLSDNSSSSEIMNISALEETSGVETEDNKIDNIIKYDQFLSTISKQDIKVVPSTKPNYNLNTELPIEFVYPEHCIKVLNETVDSVPSITTNVPKDMIVEELKSIPWDSVNNTFTACVNKIKASKKYESIIHYLLDSELFNKSNVAGMFINRGRIGLPATSSIFGIAVLSMAYELISKAVDDKEFMTIATNCGMIILDQFIESASIPDQYKTIYNKYLEALSIPIFGNDTHNSLLCRASFAVDKALLHDTYGYSYIDLSMPSLTDDERLNVLKASIDVYMLLWFAETKHMVLSPQTPVNSGNYKYVNKIMYRFVRSIVLNIIQADRKSHPSDNTLGSAMLYHLSDCDRVVKRVNWTYNVYKDAVLTLLAYNKVVKRVVTDHDNDIDDVGFIKGTSVFKGIPICREILANFTTKD